MRQEVKFIIFVKSIDGGTGTYVLNLLKLKETQSFPCQITILVLEKPNFRSIDINNFIFLRKRAYYPTKYSFSLRNLFNFVEELLWFNNYIRRLNPDIVLSVDVHCNLITALCKYSARYNFKSILTTHIDILSNINERSDALLNLSLKKCISFFYNQANYLVFVSKNLRDNFIKTFKINTNRIIYIYNGIPLEKKLYKDKKALKKIIITIARLVDQKDHTTLFKSLAQLIKKIPYVKLWILSDGEKKKELKILASNLYINKNIIFFGWVKDPDKYLKMSDVFVFSSRREGFAYVLIEAMSQGLPVISTDTPFGPSEILDKGKYGILVPIGDEKAMTNAMYELLTDRKQYEYYSRMSLKRSKFFSEEKMLKAYKNLILEVLKK